MENNERKLAAVIDLGSTAIRMVVAEIGPEQQWRVIDRAGKPVLLGRDVFSTGNVSRESLIQALKILADFREIIGGWGIEEENVRVIATSALREARNRDTFIDRVFIKTGFRVEVVEGIEETRLTYIAVQHAIEDLRPQLGRSNTMIIEVGGGSTEVMLLQRSKIVASHSLNIGTVRVEQDVPIAATPDYRVKMLGERITAMTEILDNELEMKRVRLFVAVGGHARLAAVKVGKKVNELYSTIGKEQFFEFVDKIQHLNLDECVRELKVSYDDADGLVTGLLIYRQFFGETSADELIVPNTSIRDGVLINIAQGLDPQVKEHFHYQVIASALALGRKFHFDEDHALHVAKLCLKLFDDFAEDHGLGSRSRLLLEVAALLHDVGSYIRFSGHHKHSQYIVNNSEIFGLHKEQIQIVSNVVRYHRKVSPQTSHTFYISLSREDRMKVLKLASILRVADALDRGHNQRIGSFELDKQEDQLIIRCNAVGDISSEKMSMKAKSGMFEEVFGLRVILA
jgi:exopolyphosphatase / guanosine-5'-triphosphate,3'-diphosphate pyrophosphatase